MVAKSGKKNAPVKKSATKLSTQKVVEKKVEETPPVVETKVEEVPLVVETKVEETLHVVEAKVDEKPVVEKKVEESQTDSVESVFVSKLSSFVNKVNLINKEVRELQMLGKTLEKEFNNVVKVLSKHKTKKNNENRTLSGFAMPSLLSTELYEFLNIEKGTRIPRKDVTRLINEYIKTNELRNEADKRKICPDEKLMKIFNCTKEDNVTYFNLQTYMKHHFIKENTNTSTLVSV